MIHEETIQHNLTLTNAPLTNVNALVTKSIELKPIKAQLITERRLVIRREGYEVQVQNIPLNTKTITIKILQHKTELSVEDWIHGQLYMQNGYSL